MIVASMSAMAASVEVKDSASSTHVYKVYQIFTGTLDNEGKLSDIKYGTNYKGTGTGTDAEAVAEAKALGEATGTDVARDFATKLQNGSTTDGEITGNAVATLNKDNGFKETGLADGYYLVVDDTTVALTAEGDTYSRFIVQVSGDTVIAPKKSTVEEDKKITADEHDADPNTEGTGEDISEDNKADDVSIGEKVTYTIDASIPLSASDYDKFFFVINDTLSKGLTLQPETITVYHDEIKDANKLIADTDYTLFLKGDQTHPTTGNHSFEVAIKNAEDRAGQTIYVVYQAELNEEAEIGEIPNTNKTTVTYSNNPEHDYDGEDDNNDGKPDDTTKDIYGETPERETRTFTSSIQVLKVDENSAPLQGAAFTISGVSVKTVLVTTDVFTEDANGTYYKLKDGTYTTTAPSDEDTYESVGKTDRSVQGGYVSDGNGGYRVATYDELKDTKIEKFVKVTATADQYESTEKKYKKETKTTAEETSQNITTEAYVDEHGIVRFDGLGSGTYTITETKIPAGYNGIPAFTVTIGFDKTDADYDTTNDSTDADALVWKATSTLAVTSTNATGAITEMDTDNDGKIDTFQIQVENKSGSTLPSTGGMGTTLLYIGGSILVLAAAILLITKRRMNAED